MKLVIYVQDNGDNTTGDILEILKEENEITSYKNPLIASGVLKIIDLDPAIDLKYLKINEAGGIFTAAEDDVKKASDEAAATAAQAQADMVAAFAALKTAMDEELYALMETVAGTKDFNSALLFEKTWEKMVANPGDYSSLGLTARFDRGTVLKGEGLTSQAKVTAYAQECLDIAKAAEATRMQRIEQYKADVAALQATYS